jgi:hypothetical protein
MGVGWANVRPQDRVHAAATILGNRRALENLRAAIDDALLGDDNAYAEVFAHDGECYKIRIQMVSVLDHLSLPWYATVGPRAHR